MYFYKNLTPRMLGLGLLVCIASVPWSHFPQVSLSFSLSTYSLGSLVAAMFLLQMVVAVYLPKCAISRLEVRNTISGSRMQTG